MTAPDLPRWVWDLVIAVQRHEEEHARDGACLKPVLAAVPADVRDKATAIAQYVQQARRADAREPRLRHPEDVMSEKPTGAVIEIIEKGATTSSDSPGKSVIVPNDVRINGQSLLASADDPVTVTVHEISTRGDDLVRVTLTLFARRLSIRAENDTEGVAD
ncbi:hypothetical protein [Streptomyces sp. NPDC088925]|uniref:hypothetical protein n=1 Tax=Streptomyces sp. NPDC088925 TaxID=3365914 RepID=UPI00382AAE68